MHTPVLLNEVIELLNIQDGDVICDLTLGGGGHSKEILNLLKKGRLIVFDQDKRAVDEFENWLKENDYSEKSNGEFTKAGINVKTVCDNFENIDWYVKKGEANKILADLGWSSDQLDRIEGLSYLVSNSKLDLRLGSNLGVTGSDLLNIWDQKTLERMFSEYADFSFFESKALAKAVIEKRKAKLFETTDDYKGIINKVFGNKSNNSIYSRAFQALRIAVNDEFNILINLMKKSTEVLAKDGIFLVLTFHSGEEKKVKAFVDAQVKQGKVDSVLSKNKSKFISPSVSEVKQNIRARSSKLYGFVKK